MPQFLRSALTRPLLAALFVAALATAAHAVVPPAYVTQWGGIGQMVQPNGVAADGAGFVYVTDSGNSRVEKFTTAGAFVTQWGTPGSGNGQFSNPFGIAVAGGNVYVVDSGNNRVQVFTTAGAYVSQWGTAGTGNGQFQQALCVAVDAGGDVYVTDYTLNRVQRFTSTGSYVTQWGTTGTGFGQFMGMAGITIDTFNEVHIVDSGNGYVHASSNTGTYVNQYGSPGTGPGQFTAALGIATNGTDDFVADTGNNRMQWMSPGGMYLTDWGVFGTGNGQFKDPHGIAIDGGFVYVADTDNNRIQKFGFVPDAAQCTDCLSVADTCCEALPRVGGPWTNILVGTREPSPGTGFPYSVTIFNLNSSPVPAEDNNWASMTRYNGPGGTWNGDSLGTVFGLTLDEYGNIFVTHTSCYSQDQIGQVFGAAAGAVYRIDAVTGAITTFSVLPNIVDPSVTPTTEALPGLGNITYDCTHKQFFVTNLEDGKIYRIKPVGVNGATGTVVETFDPLTPDNGQPGWAPLGERLWGVQWHGNRVYYSVWAQDGSGGTGPNEIRSVGLLPSGAFDPPSDKHELNVPPLGGRAYSNPVADISFSTAGKMLLGERSMYGKTSPGAHDARVLEYACANNCWVTANQYEIGAFYNKENAAGGVDYDKHPFSGPASPIGRVWSTGDAIHLGGAYTDVVYGWQGLRPNLTPGSNVNSMLVDSDGNVASGDKTYNGDIEAPGCPEPVLGTICVGKFNDLNHNGVHDAGEPPIPGWTITLTGPGGIVITAVTDEQGKVCFTGLAAGTYTLSEVGQYPWVQTAPAGGTFTVNVANGQTVTGLLFGNYLCNNPAPCTPYPPMLVAAWPFEDLDPVGRTPDVMHPAPARNQAQLEGGAALLDGGISGHALCVSAQADDARVPYANNQIATAFGTGPFAFDVWLKPNGGVAGMRTVIEKRKRISAQPYVTVGWALYLNGLQCMLEIGDGKNTQIVAGPSLPAGQWSHVSVSVDRAPGHGTWYLNGSPFAGGDFTAPAGSVSCTADVMIGQSAADFGGASGFQGCIDELDVFANPSPPSSGILSAATVGTIHNGVIKCPDSILMPSTTTICKNQTSVTVCFNVCNNTGTSQSYHWSIAGLPVGPGCTVAGPVTFTPPAGTVTVGPYSCTTPICVTIPRPAGLTAQNATSCFAVTIVNDATGRCTTHQGAIRADNTCWCISMPAGIVGVPGLVAGGTSIGIGIGHPCDPVALQYQIVAVPANPDYPDPLECRLNGLPPGEPVIGTLTLGPGGQDPTVNVNVSFPTCYDGATPYEIILEADTDGDGVLEPIASTIVQTTYDASQTVGVRPPDLTPADVKLVAAPNPFLGGSSIGFTLPRADDVSLGVYDLSGRAVRVLQRGRLAAGEHEVRWNGRDAHGGWAPAGVYFVRLDGTGLRVQSKLVKLQ